MPALWRQSDIAVYMVCLRWRPAHEVVGQFYGNVGSGHFALSHLGIDEGFRVGVFDGYAEHQCAAASILSYFACRV